MLTLFLLLGCIGRGKFDAVQLDLDRANADLASANAAGLSLKDALAVQAVRSNALIVERARLLSDTSALRGSVDEMQAALRDLATRKGVSDQRIAEYRSLMAQFEPLIDAGKLRVRITDGRMVVDLATDILFASGSAELSASGRAAIVTVAGVLTSIPEREFQVEGHTDDVPTNPIHYASNWELASGRSLTVVKTMVESGLPANRISAASYGEQHPQESNSSDAGRAANRRIQIVVVPDLSSLPGFTELNQVAGP